MHPLLKFKSIQRALLTLLASILLTGVYPSTAQAESRLLGFTWGKKRIDSSIESAKADSEATERGYLIGPTYWNSLIRAQSSADYSGPGDGLYFSTHLFDSDHFGPNLLITEIVSASNDVKMHIPAMAVGDIEDKLPENLPSIIRYKNSWNVIKRLPRQNEPGELQIFIREPTVRDADQLFAQFKLQTDLAALIDNIKDVILRGAKEENKSTKRFMNRFKKLLLTEGLGAFQFRDQMSAEMIANVESKLTALFWAFRHKDDGYATFGVDIKKLIFKSLFSKSAQLPRQIQVSLFLLDPKLALKYSKGQITTLVLQELPQIQNMFKFLNLRRHLLNDGKSFLDPEIIEKVRNWPLPDVKISSVELFSVDLLLGVPPLLIEDYLSRRKAAAQQRYELDELVQFEKKLAPLLHPTKAIGLCHSLFSSI